MDKDKIAINITNLRKSKGLTQKELAEKLNYSDKVISKWERNESLPDIVALDALAKCFGVSIDELVGIPNKVKKELEQEESSTIQLEHTKKPSKIVIWSMLVATLIWLAMIPIGIEVFLVATFIFGIYTFIWGLLLSYNTWHTTYEGHDIVIKNIPSKTVLMIDGVIADQNHSIFRAGIKLQGQIASKTINVYLSFLFLAKCEVVIN